MGKPPHINIDFFEDLTGKVAPSEKGEPKEERIGERIRRLRTEKGVALEALSSATGLSTDELSAYESGRAQPQLGVLMKLSRALDTMFGDLISGEGKSDFTIMRKDKGAPVERIATDGQKKVYSYFSLAGNIRGRHMEPLMVHLEEIENAAPSVHEGEEFIYVIEGKVRLTIGDETHELSPGDSAYYNSTLPHFVTAARGRAVILAVLYE